MASLADRERALSFDFQLPVASDWMRPGATAMHFLGGAGFESFGETGCQIEHACALDADIHARTTQHRKPARQVALQNPLSKNHLSAVASAALLLVSEVE